MRGSTIDVDRIGKAIIQTCYPECQAWHLKLVDEDRHLIVDLSRVNFKIISPSSNDDNAIAVACLLVSLAKSEAKRIDDVARIQSEMDAVCLQNSNMRKAVEREMRRKANNKDGG